jgi:hypothetical protein
LADSDEEVFKIVSDFYFYLFFVLQNEQNALESKLCVNDIKPFFTLCYCHCSQNKLECFSLISIFNLVCTKYLELKLGASKRSNDDYVKCSTQDCISPLRKYGTRLKILSRDKHSSLFYRGIIDVVKNMCRIDYLVSFRFHAERCLTFFFFIFSLFRSRSCQIYF